MAEQHRVGDRAEEGGAGEGAQESDGRVPARVEAGGDKTDDTDRGRDQIELRRVLRAGRQVGRRRYLPVDPATRAERRSCWARWPRTPARRRATDTARATAQPTATPSDAASRTGTTPKASPAANAPTAIAR